MQSFGLIKATCTVRWFFKNQNVTNYSRKKESEALYQRKKNNKMGLSIMYEYSQSCYSSLCYFPFSEELRHLISL